MQEPYFLFLRPKPEIVNQEEQENLYDWEQDGKHKDDQKQDVFAFFDEAHKARVYRKCIFIEYQFLECHNRGKYPDGKSDQRGPQ